MNAPANRPRWLAVFAAGFVLTFFWLRATSTFARVDARRAEALALAAELGLAGEEVMALLDLGHGMTSPTELRAQAEAAVAARAELGDLGLAVAAVMGDGELVRALAAGADPAVARARLRARPEGLVLTRFLAMAERYRQALGAGVR